MNQSPTAGSTFVWRDESGKASVMGYSSWRNGEPNDVNEGCVEIRGDASYEWNDLSCERQLCPVCELDAGE